MTTAGSRFTRAPSRAIIAGVVGVAVVLIAAVVAVSLRNQPPTGDPGQLAETVRELPLSVVLPVLADTTTQWRLDQVDLVPTADRMAGGSAIADIDADGVPELIIANGQVAILSWDGDGYDAPRVLAIDEAIGVTTADVDVDGFPDILVATADDIDYVVWGGSWVAGGGVPDLLELPARGQSSGLLAGELSGDDQIDIVRLGRGKEDPMPDLLWVATSSRVFEATELPLPDRFSLAGELIDADHDGLLDIWITRDVGWARGGDSVLSRQGDSTGPWVDVAAELGADLEVDGMGITLADLDGDAVIDAYVSDLGDNELLRGSLDGFIAVVDVGAAHIRPVGASDDIVSSTWGTGAIDINLDGVVDLVLGSGGFPVGTVRNKIEDTQLAVEEPPAVLLGVGDGTFVDVWQQLGIDLDLVARGLSVGDLDQDGDDDVVIVDRRGSVHVLRNDSPGPTVTFIAAEGCAGLAGQVVTATTEAGTFQRLLAPHGYASSHAAQVIVGNPTTGPVDATLAEPRELDQLPGPPLAGRVQLELDCP